MSSSGTKGRTDFGVLSCSSTPSSSILTFCWCVALSPAQSLKSDFDSSLPQSDTPFKPAFLASLKESVRADAVFESGLVTHEQGWGMPDWMDKNAARQAMVDQAEGGIQYGGMESYHNMCRFYSGPFAMHPLLAKRVPLLRFAFSPILSLTIPLSPDRCRYNWYWRLEPDVKFFCKLHYELSPCCFLDPSIRRRRRVLTLPSPSFPSAPSGSWRRTTRSTGSTSPSSRGPILYLLSTPNLRRTGMACWRRVKSARVTSVSTPIYFTRTWLREMLY